MKFTPFSDIWWSMFKRPEDRFVRDVKREISSLERKQMELVYLQADVEARLKSNEQRLQTLKGSLPEITGYAEQAKATGDDAL